MAPFWWGRRRSSSHGLWNDHRAEAERDDGADGGQGGGPPREAHVDVDVAHVEPELVVFARKPRARELWYRPHREVDMSAGLRRPSSNEEPALLDGEREQVEACAFVFDLRPDLPLDPIEGQPGRDTIDGDRDVVPFGPT